MKTESRTISTEVRIRRILMIVLVLLLLSLLSVLLLCCDGHGGAP